jgi:G3E family GTPase
MAFADLEALDASRAKKASVIILTGFLGAGKTTLLNRILTSDHGRRIAVIVNEFGEVGIDHGLLLASGQQTVAMNNGCICCQVRGDLVQNFFELAAYRSGFDTVVIETTGLAEPAPVAQSLYADDRIRNAFTLDGVVTVVDAKHIASQLEESAEAREQIAFADLILLNKTDLATPETLDGIEHTIASLNQTAKIYRTRNSDVDLDVVFGMIGADPAERMEAALTAHAHGNDQESGHDGHHDHRHHHLQDIGTVSVVKKGALDGTKLSLWLRSLAGELGSGLLRMKGILDLNGDPDQFVFQGVRTEFEGRPGRAWGKDEERINRLVFIGRKLDREKIERGFDGCLFTGPPTGSATADPFGRVIDTTSPQRLEQIRYWMRQNFGFAKDVPIIIKEVPCVKAGCPPIETAIVAILMREPPRYFKVQRPIHEVTFDHVYDLIENPMPCC